MSRKTDARDIHVRHDADLRVIVRCGLSSHGNPCEDVVLKPDVLDAHLSIAAVMHGKVSGMDSGIRVTYRISLVNPKRDKLRKGQLCTCNECVSVAV